MEKQANYAGWYNYDTGEYDWLDHAPETDEEAVKYIPDYAYGAARGIYRCRRAMGDDVLHAMAEALKACSA